MSPDQPCEVPLVEQLESVPLQAREMIEISACHHRNIPYGRYCHEAAEIRRLEAALITTTEVLKLANAGAEIVTRQRDILREQLVNCFQFLCAEIKHLSLTESAASGMQVLSRKTAEVLDMVEAQRS